MHLDHFFKHRFEIYLSISVFIFIFYVFSILVGRSIWIDEGMLLKNIMDSKGIFSYFNPLPFYDQAQPTFASLAHDIFINNISLEVEYIRLYIFLLSFTISFPVLYIFYRESTGWLLPLIVFLALSFTLGFYLTEIKHYAFEVAASFFVMSIFYLNSKGKVNFQASVILISFATYIGFSTLIPAFVLICYLTFLEFLASDRSFFTARVIFTLGLSFSIALVTLLHMNHLTIFQINNFDTYQSRGFFSDFKTLVSVGIASHGKYLTVAVASIVVSTIFYDKNSFVHRLNVVFILIVGLVCAAKLMGVYPVSSSRHLIWLVPFSFVLLVCGIASYFREGGVLLKSVGSFALALVLFQAVSVVYKTYNGASPELTDNNKLYHELAKLEPAKIAVYPHALPTLEYYLNVNDGLGKHSYFGVDEYVSGSKDPETNRSRFFDRIEKSVEFLSNNEFYYLISHLKTSLSSEDDYGWRRKYLIGRFHDGNCSYKEVYSAHRVQLLKVSCINNKMID